MGKGIAIFPPIRVISEIRGRFFYAVFATSAVSLPALRVLLLFAPFLQSLDLSVETEENFTNSAHAGRDEDARPIPSATLVHVASSGLVSEQNVRSATAWLMFCF